jgi:hypothetical protein
MHISRTVFKLIKVKILFCANYHFLDVCGGFALPESCRICRSIKMCIRSAKSPRNITTLNIAFEIRIRHIETHLECAWLLSKLLWCGLQEGDSIACMYVCMYVCVCVCMCVCMYVWLLPCVESESCSIILLDILKHSASESSSSILNLSRLRAFWIWVFFKHSESESSSSILNLSLLHAFWIWVFFKHPARHLEAVESRDHPRLYSCSSTHVQQDTPWPASRRKRWWAMEDLGGYIVVSISIFLSSKDFWVLKQGTLRLASRATVTVTRYSDIYMCVCVCVCLCVCTYNHSTFGKYSKKYHKIASQINNA